jgi:hypothetical protein
MQCFLCGLTQGYNEDQRVKQHPQNRNLCTIGNLDMCTPVRKLHVAFKLSYVYGYITKLCSTQAEAILNHVNPNVCGIGQGEARRRKHKRLKRGSGQAYDHSAD